MNVIWTAPPPIIPPRQDLSTGLYDEIPASANGGMDKPIYDDTYAHLQPSTNFYDSFGQKPRRQSEARTTNEQNPATAKPAKRDDNKFGTYIHFSP